MEHCHAVCGKTRGEAAILPGIHKAGDGYIAEWELVIDGQDVEHVAGVSPANARCRPLLRLPSKPSEVPAETAEKMLHRFIACIVDALIRSAVQCGERQPFLPNKSSKKRRTVDSVHDAWPSGFTDCGCDD